MAPPLPPNDLEHVLFHTRDLWDEMRGQRIFITGGTGFFGCWLVETFAFINRVLDLSAHATVLTRDPVAFSKKCPHIASDAAISLIAGDVRNFQYPDQEFKYVIHAATDTSVKPGAQNTIERLETILDGTERTLRFAAQHGARKLLFTSSGAVYGKQRVPRVAEDDRGAPDPLDPASVYAEGKRAAELICALYAQSHAIDCKIARCFAFVGPHLPLDTHFAIGNFIGDAMRGGPIEIGGDGTPTRSYLYAADLAVWLWTMLFRAPSVRAYNVGSENVVSIGELAHHVSSALDPGVKVNIAQEPVEGREIHRYVPLTRRAREELGLVEHIRLDDAIRRTAAWYGLAQK